MKYRLFKAIGLGLKFLILGYFRITNLVVKVPPHVSGKNQFLSHVSTANHVSCQYEEITIGITELRDEQ